MVERALALLSASIRLAGAPFMAGRFRQQALPVVLQLLAKGTAATSSSSPRGGAAAAEKGSSSECLLMIERGWEDSSMQEGRGGGPSARTAQQQHRHSHQPLAPAAIQRVRIAALECLAASMTPEPASAPLQPASVDPAGSKAGMATDPPAASLPPMSGLSGLAWEMALAAVPFLGQSHAAPLRSAAAITVMAAAGLDPDAVWMILYDLVIGAPIAAPQVAAGSSPGGDSSVHQVGTESAGLQLPTWTGQRRGGPSSRKGGSTSWAWIDSATVTADCHQLAHQLLSKVETSSLAVTWWSQAPVVAPDWQQDMEF